MNECTRNPQATSQFISLLQDCKSRLASAACLRERLKENAPANARQEFVARTNEVFNTVFRACQDLLSPLLKIFQDLFLEVLGRRFSSRKPINPRVRRSRGHCRTELARQNQTQGTHQRRVSAKRR